MPTNRIRPRCSRFVVAVGLAATSGAASAPARGEGSSAPPPVKRVARELRTGAKSVIVFVSAGDKEYVATGGARRPTGDRRFRVGSVTKTFTATIVLKLVEEGALRLSSTLEDHVPGVIPRGDEITIRQLLQHRSGLADIGEYPSSLERALRSPSTRPIDSLRFAGSKPLALRPRQQGALLEHELHRVGSRHREGHGALVRTRSSRSASSNRSGSTTPNWRRRGVCLISTTAATTRMSRGRPARSSRTRTTSPVSTPRFSPGAFCPPPPSKR